MKYNENRKYYIAVSFLIIVSVIVNIIGFSIGYIFYNYVCNYKVNKNETTYTVFKSTFDYKRLNMLKQKDVSIKSRYGYNISGTYIVNKPKTRNCIVIVHGIGGSRWEGMKYADIYLNLGFNVLIYDMRYHGKTGGSNITLGIFEKYDLDSCIKWVKNLNPGGKIGVQGESLGAVTSLLQSELNIREKLVDFYVVDCPYSDLKDMFVYTLNKDFNINGRVADIIMFYTYAVAYIKSGCNLYNSSPITAIENVSTPIMFVHGLKDKVIPYTMSLDLYNAKKGEKYLYIEQDADHAMSYLDNKVAYFNNVRNFLQMIRIIGKPKTSKF